MKSLTQAVSRADVDLKDGHAAPRAQPRSPFHDDLINDTCNRNERSGGRAQLSGEHVVVGRNTNMFSSCEKWIYLCDVWSEMKRRLLLARPPLTLRFCSLVSAQVFTRGGAHTWSRSGPSARRSRPVRARSS